MIDHLIQVAEGSATLTATTLSKKEKRLTNAEIEAKKAVQNARNRKSYHKDVNASREYCRDKYHRRTERMTPEERKAWFKRKNHLTYLRKMAKKKADPEAYEAEKKATAIKRHNAYMAWKETRTEEDMKKNAEAQRRYYVRKQATLTDEEKAEINRKRLEKQKARINAMTPEELEAYKERKREIGRKSYHKRKSIHKYKKMYFQKSA